MANRRRARRILVVNPNSNAAITRILETQGRAAAAPETEILAVTAPFGPASIESRAESAIAAHAVLTATARHHRQVDGIAIAAFSDPGLLAARETLPVPVVGMAEAAIQAAAESGRRFSIVTIGRHLEPVLRAQVRDYGYAEALLDILFVEGCVLGLIDDRNAFAAATRTLADQAIGGGAQAIVLGGAPFSGIADRLAEQIPAPIYGGIGPAVRHLDSLPLRAEERAAPRIAAHSSKAYPGLEPQLADLLDASLTRLRQSDGSCYGAE